jgi:poly(hydroxyalkanoate) depolymerase family esterase
MSLPLRASLWLPCFALMASCASSQEDATPPRTPIESQIKEEETLQGEYLGYSYRLFVPRRYLNEARPLVLLLHGCLQEASSFANVSGLEALAATKRFYVLSPQQKGTQNANGCWNWFDAENQQRGSGEPADLVALLDDVRKKADVDGAKIFAVGFSAGGGMTSILGATYPDVFSGLGVHSGLAYRAASSPLLATWAMAQGGPNPTGQGDDAYLAMGIHAKGMPVIIIHGDTDFTVRPVNAEHLVTQWVQTNDWATDGQDDDNIDDVPEFTAYEEKGGKRCQRKVYQDEKTRRVWVESLRISEMGHEFSGGLEAAPFVVTEGPSAVEAFVRFFEL